MHQRQQLPEHKRKHDATLSSDDSSQSTTKKARTEPSSLMLFKSPTTTHQSPHKIFTDAFDEFLVLIKPRPTHFHLSECLREVGNYYVKLVEQSSDTFDNPEILFSAYALIEKAKILEPLSTNAEHNRIKLLNLSTALSSDKGIYNEINMEMRLDAYKDELIRLHSCEFFKRSLRSHVNDVDEKYAHESPVTLKKILEFIAKSNIVRDLINRKIPEDKKEKAEKIFSEAAQTIHSQYEAANNNEQNHAPQPKV